MTNKKNFDTALAIHPVNEIATMAPHPPIRSVPLVRSAVEFFAFGLAKPGDGSPY